LPKADVPPTLTIVPKLVHAAAGFSRWEKMLLLRRHDPVNVRAGAVVTDCALHVAANRAMQQHDDNRSAAPNAVGGRPDAPTALGRSAGIVVEGQLYVDP